MPTFDYRFPVTSPTSGIPLGNGLLGVLLWSDGRRIHLTLGRQDHWAHGTRVRLKQRASLERAAAVAATTAAGALPPMLEPTDPERPLPRLLPIGRVSLDGAGDLSRGVLRADTGEAELGNVRVLVPRDRAVCVLLGEHLPEMSLVPAVAAEIEAFRQAMQAGPCELVRQEGLTAWLDRIAGDAVLAVGVTLRPWGAVVGTARAATDAAALQTLREQLREAAEQVGRLRAATAAFYQDWWGRVARVDLPDPQLQALYDIGLWRMATMTAPRAPLVALQGPWLEDTRLPAWSGDYHFNVNVQMAHWPMLPAGAAELYEPLIRLMRAWLPRMREWAREYAGVQDGLLLPMSVDDRCEPTSLGWNNILDPAAGGWTALQLWEHYRYTTDAEVLREVTYPLLRGALALYQGLIRPRSAGGCGLELGPAPSPEYHAPVAAWGIDASYQLAVVHGLLRAAQAAASVLGVDADRAQAWAELARRLPRASVIDGRIAVWRDLPLTQSHRHPSHLAGIHPFDFLPAGGEADERLIDESLRQWVAVGTGEWTGWTLPWNAMLWSARGNATVATASLRAFADYFTGPNHTPRHNARHEGFTLWTWGGEWQDIMQLDGLMGFVAACLHVLVHEQGGRRRIGAAVPEGWEWVSFERIRLPGGVIVSGERRGRAWNTAFS